MRRDRPIYNEANLLNAVDVNLRGAATATPFVKNIDYDEKGQRQLIRYGNDVVTTYNYDDRTFRLIHLRTVRAIDGAPLQDLHYTYDPVGNITMIRDDAQQPNYFNGQVVSPSNQYEYDALYRLISAAGREHIGQTTNPPPETRSDLKPHYDANDWTRCNLPHPNDGQAMRNYTEAYEYDGVGNILAMIHQATGGAWTRRYGYEATNNRLRTTSLPGDGDDVTLLSSRYQYDRHGNMIVMPHLPLMQWDYRDQLQATSQQVVNNGGTPEITYYVYDAAGQRVRKVTERQAPAGDTPKRKQERIYLGSFEIFRAYAGDGETVTLERETLHIMDDKQRIALVETRTLDTADNDPAPQQLIRYQLGNHLGSASLELDDQAQIISYEEYFPYGSTSYQAVRSQTETAKRYRYTGKERDEESGLYYHGARYYAAWLGRWVSCDPLGLVDGCNIFSYVHNSPITASDPHGTQEKDEVDSREDIVYTTNQLMAQAINQLTDNTLQQALDLNTGNTLPSGAPGGMFVSRYDPELSPHIPNLIVIGGYDVKKAFRNYFISPEQTFVDRSGNTTVKPAAIVDLGISYGEPDAMEVIKMGLDVTTIVSLALKTAFVASSSVKALPPAAAGIAGLNPRVAADAMSLNFRSIDEQVGFLVQNVPGTESKQIRLLLEKAFEKGSSAVLGGSRIRGTSHLASDLDVGFNNLTANQAAKVTDKVSKVGPLQLESTRIVTGNETANIPKIISPEEFFQRVGTRAATDAKAGQVFLPSGSLTVTPGTVPFIPPGIRP